MTGFAVIFARAVAECRSVIDTWVGRSQHLAAGAVVDVASMIRGKERSGSKDDFIAAAPRLSWTLIVSNYVIAIMVNGSAP